jgi:hypothetical protein
MNVMFNKIIDEMSDIRIIKPGVRVEFERRHQIFRHLG